MNRDDRNDPRAPFDASDAVALPDPAQTSALVLLAASLAREAGDLVREGRTHGVDIAARKSSVVDIVTEMDLASERLLRERLAAERPLDGILGEEGDDVLGTSGLTWVLDPIDGTVNYLYGLPAYAVSIAVVAGPVDPVLWTVVAAAVINAADGHLWTAGRGLGARLDGDRIQVGAPRSFEESLIATGFGYSADRRRRQGEIVAGLVGQIRDIRRIGTSAFDLCAVAAGQLDGFYERGLKPWDLAAGSLIAAEAGASVTGLNGARAGEAMTVAASPVTAALLVRYLESQGADEGY